MKVGCGDMKILASDFDYTLYIKDDDIMQKNVDAIRRFIKNGNLFGIVTGRNYSSIKVLLNQYDIPYHYLVCQDGAKIFDSMDYCFSTTNLSREEIVQIVPVLEKEHFNYFLDDGYNETTNMDDCVKVVGVIGDKREDAKKIVDCLREMGFYAYLSSYYINILHGSVNKKEALEKILVHADCYKEDLYVIGDGDNDYEMITAFHGVIMKKHQKSLDHLDCPQYRTLYEYIEELEKN